MELTKPDRNVSLDIAKGILIILVVFAHVIESINVADDANYVYIIHAIIYSFHMPAFIFISGYLSKNDIKVYKNCIGSCLLPFIGLNIIYSVIKGNLNILMPGPALWYFLCLFYWRISTGAFKRIKFIIPISIIFALFVGFIPDVNAFMGISRAICFYPLFLLGYFFDEKGLKRLKEIPVIIPWITFLITIFASVIIKLYVFPDLSYALKDPYNLSNISTAVTGLIQRIILLLIFCFGTLSFVSLTSRVMRKNIFSTIGCRTVSIYALHVFLIHGAIKIFGKIPIYNAFMSTWGGVIAVSVVITIITICILGNVYIYDLYNRIMKSIANIIIKK